MAEEFRFDGVPSAEAVLKGQNLDRLTPAERAEIEAYAWSGYETINPAMRGHLPMTASVMRRIDVIRSGLAKYPLPESVQVSRETDATIYDLVDRVSAEALIGREFVERAFMSTSGTLNPPHTMTRAHPVILDLLVPAGVCALRLGELAEFDHEREVLLIDAQAYFVIGVAFDSERKVWRIQAVVTEGEL